MQNTFECTDAVEKMAKFLKSKGFWLKFEIIIKNINIEGSYYLFLKTAIKLVDLLSLKLKAWFF